MQTKGLAGAIAALALLAALTLTHTRPTNLIPQAYAREAPAITQGSLIRLDDKGQASLPCPLKHTAVKAEISGFLNRVVVTQQFENPYEDKIEAVYTFPLPQNAAVDDMTILVGERVVRGKVKPREEARAIYDAARAAGHVAALLDQERPNIFTQSVANIMPGDKVTVTISYIETLQWEEGSYEFVFPMVVGPRYIPGQPEGKQGGGWAPDTKQVPDASRVTPPVTPPGTRAGHDISIEVAIDAGVPLQDLTVKSHEILVERPGPSKAVLRLKNKGILPNKDFVLRYTVAGNKIEDAVLTHYSSQGGFFTLILQPPERVTVEDVTPKELVFVLDTSGSMSGFPIDKAKETMNLALAGLYPRDTFNLITFAGDTEVLFPHPAPATRENLRRAQQFLESRQGGGGTEMMKAIRTALDPSDSQEHVRIVCFMTDGYVGNDMAILDEIQKHPNARIFSFGIGSSVNRFLLDKMADAGRGEAEYVALNDDGSAAARRFHERVRNPLLTDITVAWEGVTASDVYPKRIPDLFSAQPVVLSGRYSGSGEGAVRLRGKMSGRSFERRIPVAFSKNASSHEALKALWARTRIDDLMGQDWAGLQQGTARPEIKKEITQLGIDHRLMTQFTSFVAVEELAITDGGTPRRVEVPVEMPEGVRYEGVFGDRFSDTVASTQLGGALRLAYANKSLGASPAPAAQRMPTRAEQASSREGYLGDESDKPLSEAEQKLQLARSKMHPALRTLQDHAARGGSGITNEDRRYLKNGKVEVQVWLEEATPEVLQTLKNLGFELLPNPRLTNNIVLGRISPEKLQALAEMESVRYIGPFQP
jgi:Ca-activated chloride channel family protein